MTKVEQKIIKLLGDYPEREFYAQEIARKVRCSKASAGNVLKLLDAKGIVFKKARGHMKFYRINPQNIEVKRLKIGFALEKLNAVLPKIKKISSKIILFGSASRGEQTFKSDLDLLIISADKESVQDVMKEIGPRLKIKPIIKTPGEWSEMEIKEPEFYQEVKNGIVLYNYVSRI